VASAAVAEVMRARLDLAVSKGCDGVEPDNVDGYANDTGFPLTEKDQLASNRFLSNFLHVRQHSPPASTPHAGEHIHREGPS
jgi:hypothetical protein